MKNAETKKNIEEYVNLPYKVEIVADAEEGGYVASFPELPGCLSSGETVEEAFKNAMDAKRAWLEAALEDGLSIPEPEAQHSYSGRFKLRIPKTLHRRLAEAARAEGISMNQYCIFLLSKNLTY